MLSEFLKHIELQNIDWHKSKFLLSVSGGMDSMCMLDLFKSNNIEIGVAHINHGLRPMESESEETLVKKICEHRNIPFYLKQLDPHIFENGNTQEKAREERYRFLNSILEKDQYDYICTAHHTDDDIETFIINFARGSGLAGLNGINKFKGVILRPMLPFSKKDIVNYVGENSISFLEDSSNQENKYLRNQIRNELIPVIKNIFADINQTARISIDNLNDTSNLLSELIENWSEVHCILEKGQHKIPITSIKLINGNQTLLYELLKPFGYSRKQISSILSSIESVGRVFHSSTHELLVDREFLIIRENVKSKSEIGKILTREVDQFQVHQDPFLEIVSNKALIFPLTIRKPEQGEYMQPLGMGGKSKLISDILIDKKINKYDKEQILMAYSDKIPVWLIGITIDERFKVNSEADSLLELQFIA